MSLITVSLIVLSLIGLVVGDGSILAKVCDDGSKEVPILNDVQQVRNLISAFKSNPGQCADKFADSITQLELVLSEDNLKDVCSGKAVDQIEAYHSEFIHFYTAKRSSKELRELKKRHHSDRTKAIPKALYQFFILFGKHVSAKCRSEIPQRLHEIVESQNLVDDGDFKPFDKVFSNEKTTVKRVLSKAARFVSGSALSDLSPPTVGVRFNVAIPDKTVVPQMQELCRAKLRPIYDELLVPAVRLNDLGYSGRQFDSQKLGAALASPQLVRWYRAYQVCEALRRISLVVIPKETCESKRKCYGFLTDEEADEARTSKAVIPKLSPVQSIQIAHEPVELDGYLDHYQTRSDADLAVAKFNGHANRRVLQSNLIEIDMKFNRKLIKMLGLRPIPKGEFIPRHTITIIVSALAIIIFIMMILNATGVMAG